jgi:hypothetical protein
MAREDDMLELSELQQLLSEIAGLVKSGTRSDKRKAADKLQRLATIRPKF